MRKIEQALLKTFSTPFIFTVKITYKHKFPLDLVSSIGISLILTSENYKIFSKKTIYLHRILNQILKKSTKLCKF